MHVHKGVLCAQHMHNVHAASLVILCLKHAHVQGMLCAQHMHNVPMEPHIVPWPAHGQHICNATRHALLCAMSTVVP